MDALARFQADCSAFFDRISENGRCPLVFGEGPSCPLLMLIGEAPGEQEAIQGRPFVGKAGKNLTAFLEVLGLERSQLYVSNVVKFRPTKVSAAGRLVNRPPTKAEREMFRPWLMEEIRIIRPDALVTLGNVALQAFVDDTVGHLHGSWTRAVVDAAPHPSFTVPLFPLYHPASVIYNRSLATTYQSDLEILRDSLAARSAAESDN